MIRFKREITIMKHTYILTISSLWTLCTCAENMVVITAVASLRTVPVDYVLGNRARYQGKSGYVRAAFMNALSKHCHRNCAILLRTAKFFIMKTLSVLKISTMAGLRLSFLNNLAIVAARNASNMS